MKISRNFIVFIILSFACKVFSFTTINPVSINYKIEDGLPSDELYFSIQDKNGNMWFSSDFGLVKFDGYHFKTYGRKQGLKEISVFFLQETSDGKIWMNTLSGDFYFYDPESDLIKPYKYNDIYHKYHRHIDVYRFHVDDKGTLYFPWKNQIVSIAEDGEIDKLFVSNETSILIKLFHNNKALSTPVYSKNGFKTIKQIYSQNISVVGPKLKKYNINYKGSDYYYSRYNNLIMEDSTILIATENNALLIIRNDSIIAKNYQSSIHSMTEDPSNKCIYLCMGDHRGVLRYRDINALLNEEYDIIAQNEIATHITIDDCNGLWITTTKNGIIYIPNLSSNIIAKDVFKQDDLIMLLVQYDDDNFYFSSSKGKIARYNLFNNESEIIYNGNDKIRELFLDKKENKLWFFTFTETYIYDILTRDIKTLGIWPVSINIYDNQHLIINSNNKIYIINRKDFTYNKKISFPDMTDIRLFSTSILKDSIIYVGMINGTYYIENEKLISFNNDITCLSERIQEICQLSNGSLVYRVRGCGIIISSLNGFLYIDTEEGLLSNDITRIHIDKYDNIWTCSRKGLNKIHFSSNNSFKIYSFTTNNGLPSNHIYDINISRNKLYVATNKGLVQLDKNKHSYCLATPRIISVSANNISHSLPEKDKIVFKYDNNNLDIQFISIDFSQNSQIKYRYKIKSNHTWEETYQTNVLFSSLEYGVYNFEIQSSTINGYWSTSSYFSFEITAPWWNTISFKNLMVLLLIIIFYLLYKYKTSLIEKEYQFKHKINDIENKFLRAQINPHFIFNALNSISYFISNNDKEKANSFLRDFSALIRFNLNATKRKLVPLSEEISALESLLILESQRFPNKFNYQIRLNNIDAQFVMIPPMLLQPIVENALIHGIFHLKNKKGELRIDFEGSNKDHFTCTIRDNGIGFKKSALKKISSNKFNGIGIQNVKDRIHLINESTNNVSIELYFINKPLGSGTEVKFNFRSL